MQSDREYSRPFRPAVVNMSATKMLEFKPSYLSLRNKSGQETKSTTMTAKIKCSNCGAEISNLSFSWGKKYLWLMIPVMLLGFLPVLRLTTFRGDATKELALSGIEKRQNVDSLSIVGLVTNTGSHNWSSVSLEAEFYDAAGNFIDEGADYLRANIPAGGKEQFKITVKVHPDGVKAPDTKMVVKVVGGHTMPF